MSRDRLAYYKAYPRDFVEGTIGMPFEIKCAYRVVLDLIYMQSGKLPDDARYISGLLGCSIRKWKSIRLALIEADKLQVSGEFLTNYRAVSELESLSKYQEKQAENRRDCNKNKDLQKPPLNHSRVKTEPEPNKEKEIDKSISKKGSRLPDDWLAPKEFVDWPVQNLGWTENRAQGELAKFKDYWVSKTGQGATKLDWLATWRNWCRNAKTPNIPHQRRTLAQVAMDQVRAENERKVHEQSTADRGADFLISYAKQLGT